MPALRGQFRCPEDVFGQRILIVDDVRASGATAEETARALRAAGARRVASIAAIRTMEFALGHVTKEFAEARFLADSAVARTAAHDAAWMSDQVSTPGRFPIPTMKTGLSSESRKLRFGWRQRTCDPRDNFRRCRRSTSRRLPFGRPVTCGTVSLSYRRRRVAAGPSVSPLVVGGQPQPVPNKAGERDGEHHEHRHVEQPPRALWVHNVSSIGSNGETVIRSTVDGRRGETPSTRQQPRNLVQTSRPLT